MPILDQVQLFLDGTYSSEEKKGFIFKSRCICNYLERALGEKEFETTLSRVNIHCSRDENQVRVEPLRHEPFLEVCIKYDFPLIADLDEISLQGHYARIIDWGLRAAENFMPVPHSYCMNILRRFKEEGFKNEWIEAEKKWDQWSIRSDILARLTTEKFSLWHRVYREGQPTATRLVVETKPREWLFLDYLGDLSLDRSRNVVYKAKRKVLSMFDVKSGQFC